MSPIANETYYSNRTDNTLLGRCLFVTLNTACPPAEMATLPMLVYKELRQHLTVHNAQHPPKIASVVIKHPHVSYNHGYGLDVERQNTITTVIGNIFNLIACIPGLQHLNIAYNNTLTVQHSAMDFIGHAIYTSLQRMSQGPHIHRLHTLIVDFTVRDINLPLIIASSEGITRMLIENPQLFPALSVFDNYMNVVSNDKEYKYSSNFFDLLCARIKKTRPNAILGGGFRIYVEAA